MEYLAYELLVYVPIAKEDLHSFTLRLLSQTIHSENEIESDVMTLVALNVYYFSTEIIFWFPAVYITNILFPKIIHILMFCK